MNTYLLFLLLLSVYIKDAMSEEETVEVQSPLGRILGSTMETRRGRKIFSFRGMRYADAPVGELRFKPAQPVKAWDGVLNATEEGPACPQPGIRLPSEDCLRLNVYSTELPTKDHNPSRPVIVYFHPGGFYVFSGQSYAVGPHYFLDQDIVLVTANYRLGSLGFLSTGDEVFPGNLGMKDQVAVLRWVRDNIASFGGNPNNVTLAGCSAGSWSIGLHMCSPMSRGLFHAGIAMSGAATGQTLLPLHQKHIALKQAEIFGCNKTDTSRDILDCLKDQSAIEMGESLLKFYEWRYNPTLIWSPVVEPEIPGVERFLEEDPVNLIRSGQFYQVPLIVGVTEVEFGGYVTKAVEDARKGDNSIFDDMNQNWTRVAPICFQYNREQPRSGEISEEFRKFYLKGQPAGKDNYIGLGQLYADALIGFSVHRFVNLIAEHSKEPVYHYELTYPGRYSHFGWSNDTPHKTPYGPGHHDDLLYLFYNEYFPYFNLTDPESKNVDRITSMFANFAKTRHPISAENHDLCDVEWTVFTKENQAYLDLGENLVMKARLNTDRMQLWERLFPLPQIPQRCYMKT